jgi:hypothetical protein
MAIVALVAGYALYARHRVVRRHQMKARASG